MLKTRKRSKAGYASPEAWEYARHNATLATVGLVEAGVRLDRELLSDSERSDLARLTELAGGGFNIGRLPDRARRRYEELVEKGSGREPGSLFAAARKSAELAAGFAEIERDLRKPPRRIDVHEEGSVTLSKLLAHDWFANADGPVLWISQVGLAVFIVGQLENGVALTRNGRIEGFGEDAVLFIDKFLGPGVKFDDDDRLIGWQRDLEHLAVNQVFEVETVDRWVKVKRGRKLRSQARRAA